MEERTAFGDEAMMLCFNNSTLSLWRVMTEQKAARATGSTMAPLRTNQAVDTTSQAKANPGKSHPVSRAVPNIQSIQYHSMVHPTVPIVP
jgi:hypothetical protein